MKWLLGTLLVVGVGGFVSIGAMSVRSKALIETMSDQMHTLHAEQRRIVREVSELTGEVRKLNGGG